MAEGGLFEDTPIQDYFQMMRLNNQATVGLDVPFPSRFEGPPEGVLFLIRVVWKRRFHFLIKLFIQAQKNFIYAFSLALREELKFGKVSVSVLCPGPVLTDNEDSLKRFAAQGNRSKALVQMPDQVASICHPSHA